MGWGAISVDLEGAEHEAVKGVVYGLTGSLQKIHSVLTLQYLKQGHCR